MRKVTNPVQNLFKFRVSLLENTHAISHVTGAHSTSIPGAKCWLCWGQLPVFFLAVFRCNCKAGTLLSTQEGGCRRALALLIGLEAPRVQVILDGTRRTVLIDEGALSSESVVQASSGTFQEVREQQSLLCFSLRKDIPGTFRGFSSNSFERQPLISSQQAPGLTICGFATFLFIYSIPLKKKNTLACILETVLK